MYLLSTGKPRIIPTGGWSCSAERSGIPQNAAKVSWVGPMCRSRWGAMYHRVYRQIAVHAMQKPPQRARNHWMELSFVFVSLVLCGDGLSPISVARRRWSNAVGFEPGNGGRGPSLQKKKKCRA